MGLGRALDKKRYRNEWKYCERDVDLQLMKEKIENVLMRDSHAGLNGKYTVNSLYFDDYKDSCARYNVAGEGNRFKYRIRYYGENAERLWLEKKEKKNNYCHKRKCAISREEYLAICNGNAMDVFWNSEEKLIQEFCTDIVTKRFLPRVIISYEREAFIEPITNIRITFDYNITASEQIDKFLEKSYLQVPILDKEKHVLEIKFDDILPSHIRRYLCTDVLIQRSFSKYYLGRIAIQEKNRFSKCF